MNLELLQTVDQSYPEDGRYSCSNSEPSQPEAKRPHFDEHSIESTSSGVFVVEDADTTGPICNTAKDKSKVKHHTAGIVVGAWPCGTIVMVGELFRAESKSQVYGNIHTFLQENGQATDNLAQRTVSRYSITFCLELTGKTLAVPVSLDIGRVYLGLKHSDGILDSGSEALTCAFNRRGTLLAVGCNDGRIAVWDFMTRGIARMLNGHIHPITSLSWNRSGHKLLSSSTDWNVLLWDIASGEIDLRFRFPSPVLKAQFHPRNSNIFLVCPIKNAPVLVRREDDDYRHVPLPTDGEPQLNIVASFDRRGQRIVTGSSKGKVLIIDTSSLEILKSFKIGSGTTSTIKCIEFARRGSNFLVNTADRVIRVFDIEGILKEEEGEVEALQRLQDLVNRTQWKTCTFSGDGEFIVAGSHRQHALYIWDKATGSLVKMLTGQKGETLLDIVWHPVRPIILSISTGVVNVWSQAQVELWSAYAPNFKELDENDEYEEKEDEFDIEDEDKKLEGEEDRDGDITNIDTVTVAPIPAFCSSDEDTEEPLDWLPMAPEIEEPEEPGWGQLEPSLNELPTVESTGERKRPANDENVDPAIKPPSPKQPRTIEIDLPSHNHYDETIHKEPKPKGTSKSSKKSKGGSKGSQKSQTAIQKDGTKEPILTATEECHELPKESRAETSPLPKESRAETSPVCADNVSGIEDSAISTATVEVTKSSSQMLCMPSSDTKL